MCNFNGVFVNISLIYLDSREGDCRGSVGADHQRHYGGAQGTKHVGELQAQGNVDKTDMVTYKNIHSGPWTTRSSSFILVKVHYAILPAEGSGLLCVSRTNY